MIRLPSPCGVVTLLSDFGLRDPYVGIMKGAVLSRCRDARLVDLCHQVPAQDVTLGARFLGAAIDRFPGGTVHVAVVDPGVGTERRMLAVAAAGDYWIAPDNGLLDAMLARDDAVVLALQPQALGLRAAARTFHGRDYFAPAAGMLAARQCGFEALGRRIDDPVRLPARPGACVIHVDHFGNLLTDLAAADDIVALAVGEREFPVVPTYGCQPAGSVVALANSYDQLEIAVVGGSAAALLGIAVGASVRAVRSLAMEEQR